MELPHENYLVYLQICLYSLMIPFNILVRNNLAIDIFVWLSFSYIWSIQSFTWNKLHNYNIVTGRTTGSLVIICSD